MPYYRDQGIGLTWLDPKTASEAELQHEMTCMQRGLMARLLTGVEKDSRVLIVDASTKQVAMFTEHLLNWTDRPPVVSDEGSVRTKLPFTDNVFDRVVLIRGTDRPRTVAKELHRVLKPGGQLTSTEFSYNGVVDRPERTYNTSLSARVAHLRLLGFKVAISDYTQDMKYYLEYQAKVASYGNAAFHLLSFVVSDVFQQGQVAYHVLDSIK